MTHIMKHRRVYTNPQSRMDNDHGRLIVPATALIFCLDLEIPSAAFSWFLFPRHVSILEALIRRVDCIYMHIFVTFKHCTLTSIGMPNLFDLPNELLIHFFFSNLHISGFGSGLLTCHRINDIIVNSLLLQYLCHSPLMHLGRIYLPSCLGEQLRT